MSDSFRRNTGIWISIALLLVLAVFVSSVPISHQPPAQVSPNHTNWVLFLAPFHTVFLHMPIGFILIALLLELYHLFRPSPELRHATYIVCGCMAASAVVASGLGLFRGSTGAYDPQILVAHRNGGLLVAVASIFLFMLLSLISAHSVKRSTIAAYRVLLFGTVGLTLYASHFGGTLTHGSDYLVKHAPKFIKRYVQETAQTAVSASDGTEEEKFFRTSVKPILEQKCMRCHSGITHMGGYRLDDRQVAFSGGASGAPAILPGDPGGSNMVRRMLLDPMNEEAMPPIGMPRVTSEESMKIIEWVQQGAAFPPGN